MVYWRVIHQVESLPSYACSDGGRETVLLSCTHVFHLKCIQAFENFNVFGKRQCPVCRADYHKRIMP